MAKPGLKIILKSQGVTNPKPTPSTHIHEYHIHTFRNKKKEVEHYIEVFIRIFLYLLYFMNSF